MFISRYARVAERTDENGIRLVSQLPERLIWQRLPRFEVVVCTVWKTLPLEGKAMFRGCSIEHRNRGLDDLGADSVPGDDSDAMGLHGPTVRPSDAHSNPVGRPQLAQ